MLKVDSYAIYVSLNRKKINIDRRSFIYAIIRAITPNYFRTQLDTWEQFKIILRYTVAIFILIIGINKMNELSVFSNDF